VTSLDELKQLIETRLADSEGDACRLLHGRGRCYPGWEQLSVDYYHPVILVTLFDDLDPEALSELLQVLQCSGEAQGVNAIAIQYRHRRDTPLELYWGELPRKPVARENGLQFGLQLGGRQNSGFFLDMAAARAWLGQHCEDKSLLNLFAYTCAFSVVARAAGATRVVNLDMSSGALRQGQQNHQRNGINSGVSYLAHDLFRSWGKLRRQGPFDLIIVDPPSRQPGSFIAEQHYGRVIARLPLLCAPDARVLLCLNSPHLESDFLLDAVAEQAPQLQFCQRLPNPEAFVDINPELSLKVLEFSYLDSK